MKLQKITSINYASFRSFKWDKNLPSLADKINLVFGWNGTGKTSISRVLRSKEKGTVIDDGSFSLEMGGRTYKNDNQNNLSEYIRVFNEDYVRENLSARDELSHIIYAGAKAVDYSKKEDVLSAKKKELQNLDISKPHNETAKKKAREIHQITGINTYPKELIPGSTYSNYTKSDFEKRIDFFKSESRNGVEVSSYILEAESIEDLKEQLVKYDDIQKRKNRLESIVEWIQSNLRDINTMLSLIPKQQCKSKRIDELNEKQLKWVQSGVDIHFSDPDVLKQCLFCDSSIENKSELEQHFSREKLDLDNKLNHFSAEIKNHAVQLSALNTADSVYLGSYLNKLQSEIGKKLQDVLQSIVIPELDVEKMGLPKLKENKGSIAHQLERHFVAEDFERYCEQEADYNRRCGVREKLEEGIQELEEEIRELKSAASDSHKAANRLNRIFQSVFPYKSIALSNNDDDTGYILKRDGKNCDFSSLSEGERNFMALIYFLLSLEDEDNKFHKEGIVVIDDPVSSLDKNAIFKIFSLITGAIDDEANKDKQFIILTHSLDFWNHLKRRYFKNRSEDEKDKILYSIDLLDSGSTIKLASKLLENNDSDYYYIFGLLHEYKKESSPEDGYIIANLLRRWLETFLNFEFPKSNFRQQLENAYAKAYEKSEQIEVFELNAVHRFLDHGSHGFSETESIDESILNNAQQNIKDIFDLVKRVNPNHWSKLLSEIKKSKR